jgi:uncharacterized membrane protein
MKKYLIVFAIFFLASPAQAQETPPVTEPPTEFQEPVQPDEIPPDTFYRAEVIEVLPFEGPTEEGEITPQRLKARFTNGDLKGQEKELLNDGIFTINGGEPLEVGQTIIVFKTSASGLEEFYVADTYRVPSLLWIIAGFFLLAIALSRWKGFMSILGLMISILVIVQFIVPQIIAGKNPLLVILIGALIIAFVSIYLAHGFNRRTTVALISTLITLAISAGLAIMFVKASRLFGLGSEEAFYIQQLGSLQNLNLQGLLLGGIILGALGVLDDITTAQTAAVYEIRRANPSLSVQELFSRGLNIGREHISSLVNTLFLAYAGASLPLFLFFTVGGNTQPLWVTLNSEFIAEEVIRTLVGSISLMLAVPITTFLAAYYFGRREINPQEVPTTTHHHHSH